MDPERFDALVQALAAPGSRRSLLGGVLAGAVAPLTAAAKAKRHRSGRGDASRSGVRQPADANAASSGPQPSACLAIGKRCTLTAGQDARHGTGKRKGKGKHHPPSCTKCCSRFGAAGPDGKARCACKPEGESCDNPSECCGGLCRNGQCTKCPNDLTACDGNCVDLQTDGQHCGDCTTRCADGQRCVGGTCVCDRTSCPRGCCDQNGTCQRGTDDQACGVGGADCQACQTCHACDGTTCAAQSGVCCGDNAICTNGVCTTCDSGQRCQRGQCVCDATSCPNGCCNGAQCVLFADQTDQQCGTNGATCKKCTGNDTCGGGNPGTPGVCGCTAATTCPNGQTCGSAPNGCDGTIVCTGCAGCCDGNDCQAGTDDGACGKNGAGCVSCSSPSVCYEQGCCTPDPDATTCAGKCGTIQNNCGQTVNCTALCAGCCNGSVCQAGTSDGACGKNGAACATCASPASCYAQACCTPQCAGKKCGDSNGCGGTCDGTCPSDLPICQATDRLHCCCPADSPWQLICVANENDPSQVCCCLGGGYCRISPSGAACCCSYANQICTDEHGCATPPAG